MQNLENLKSRILEEANAKAQSILDEARTRAKAITNEAERKAFSETRQIEDETAALIEGKRRTAKVSMDLEERDSVLKAKRDRIDELVNSVPGAVKNIPSIEYVNFLKNLFVECAPSGVVKVYTSRADADKITPTFLAEVSAQISQKGRSTTFSLMNESSDLDNGAVLKNDVVEVECSVNALLRSYREDLESIVATTLFDEGHDLEE